MAIDTPPGIVLEIARDDLPEDLFPDERAYVMRCVPRRVNEFVRAGCLGATRVPQTAPLVAGWTWPRLATWNGGLDDPL